SCPTAAHRSPWYPCASGVAGSSCGKLRTTKSWLPQVDPAAAAVVDARTDVVVDVAAADDVSSPSEPTAQTAPAMTARSSADPSASAPARPIRRRPDTVSAGTPGAGPDASTGPPAALGPGSRKAAETAAASP